VDSDRTDTKGTIGVAYDWNRNGGDTYWTSIRLLIGHLVGTAVIFVTLFTLAWGLATLLSWFNTIHPFPLQIFAFVTKLEIGLVYADAVFCAIVLLGGTWRFLKEILL
jgi:hypothetical protein